MLYATVERGFSVNKEVESYNLLAHLEDQKKQKTEQAGRKRKLVSDEVEQLKNRSCVSQMTLKL